MRFTEQLETIGAIAGLAAVVGLAVLSLLYFAQAREVKRLREWAGRAPERAAEAEQRAQELARQQAQRRVVAQPAVAQVAAGAGAATTAAAAAQTRPGAPAPPAPGQPTPGPAPPGRAAPVTATPATVSPAGQPQPAAPATPGGAPSTPAGAPTPDAPEAPAGPAGPAEPAGPAKPAGVPGVPGAVPAAARATPSATPSGVPAPGTAAGQGAAAGGNGSLGQETRESAVARPMPIPPPAHGGSPTAIPRGAAPPRSTTPTGGRRASSSGGSPVWPIAAIVGGAIALLAIGVVLITSLTGGDSQPRRANEIAPPPVETTAPGEDGTGATGTSVNRAETNVAVLNGTTVEGLAREVANRLGGSGFTIGQVTNNPDQSMTETVISYADGSRPAALEIAEIVGGDPTVREIDQNTSVTAGPDAEVVVTVASDRAR